MPTPTLPYVSPYDQAGYGYGWFVGERLGHRVAGHGGTYNGFRALIERYPHDEISIIILSNLESSDITVTTFPAETICGAGENLHNPMCTQLECAERNAAILHD